MRWKGEKEVRIRAGIRWEGKVTLSEAPNGTKGTNDRYWVSRSPRTRNLALTNPNRCKVKAACKGGGQGHPAGQLTA